MSHNWIRLSPWIHSSYIIWIILYDSYCLNMEGYIDFHEGCWRSNANHLLIIMSFFRCWWHFRCFAIISSYHWQQTKTYSVNSLFTSSISNPTTLLLSEPPTVDIVMSQGQKTVVSPMVSGFSDATLSRFLNGILIESVTETPLCVYGWNVVRSVLGHGVRWTSRNKRGNPIMIKA